MGMLYEPDKPTDRFSLTPDYDRLRPSSPRLTPIRGSAPRSAARSGSAGWRVLRPLDLVGTG